MTSTLARDRAAHHRILGFATRGGLGCGGLIVAYALSQGDLHFRRGESRLGFLIGKANQRFTGEDRIVGLYQHFADDADDGRHDPDLSRHRFDPAGAAMSRRSSSSESFFAAGAGSCPCILDTDAAREGTSTLRYRTVKKAALTFGVIMRFGPLKCSSRSIFILRPEFSLPGSHKVQARG
jgi:hypothetical protein